jgi:hypothetical protein
MNKLRFLLFFWCKQHQLLSWGSTIRVHVILFEKTSTILEQDLQELQNSAFLLAEMGLSQAEQHLLWQPVYTLFFVCLALVIVQGSTNYYVHMCTLC